VDGRAAKLIRFSTRPSGSVQEVAVDAESSRPLRFHHTYPGGRRSPEWRVVSIEAIARDPSQFARPPLAEPRPTQGSGSEGSRIDLAEASRALGAGVLWLGDVFAGRKIEEVQLQRVGAELTDGTEVEGVVLRIAYEDGVRVSQAVDPAGLYALGIDDGGDPTAPAGSMTVYSDPRPRVQAELRAGRTGVVLDAPSRELLLAAARKLRPMP
jgi:hypothetical protein